MEKQTHLTAFTGYQKFLVAILALLQFTIVLDFMVISPLGDMLMKSLSISTTRFGLVVSGYAFSAGISGILAAGFADKFDRKKLLLFFYTGFIAGTICCALANTYYLLLSARIVTGLFGGVIGSISMAIVTDLFEVHQRGRVMGFVQMAFAGSQVLGIPIGLWLATNWGWHSTFEMIVVLALLIGVAVFFKMKPIDRHLSLQSDKNAVLHLFHTLSNKTYHTGFLAIAFLSVGGFMLMPFGSPFLINNLHVTNEQLILIYMFTGISSIIIMPVIGILSDKIDKFILFAAGSTLSIIMIIIYTNLSPLPLWQLIGLNMILFMGIMSRIIPVTTLNTSVPEMKDRGAYMSITSSLQQMAGGVAALCAGLIVHQSSKTSPLEHYPTLGYTVAIVSACCIFLVYRVSILVKNKARAAAAASSVQGAPQTPAAPATPAASVPSAAR